MGGTKPPNRKKHRRGVAMMAAFVRQHGLCYWCGKPMLTPVECDGNARHRVTVEHLQPSSEGGRDHRSNIVAAHAKCNNLRRSSPQKPKVWDRLGIAPVGPTLSSPPGDSP